METLKKYCFLILTSMCVVAAFGQKKHSHKFKATFALAEKNFQYGYYQDALNHYMKIYSEDTLDIDLNYKIALCHYYERHHPDSIIRFLLHDDASSIPDVQLLLGKLFHLKHDFNQARLHYEKYKSFSDKKRKVSNTEIERLIGISNRAESELKSPHTAIIKNLGPQINSKYHEYVPLITGDGATMFFTSRRPKGIGDLKDVAGNYFEDIYVSKKTGMNWTQPVNLGKPVNSNDHDACVSISNDGKRMLLYRPAKNFTGGDIYESNFENNTWSQPKVLDENINSKDGNESSACISRDGNFLIFSSNKSGGIGGKDLYMCRKLPNEKWSKPLNLGSTINTPYDEDAPFLTANDRNLYFSSKGHNTIGEYDIFKSQFDIENNTWSVPENLGYPLNNVSDDIFFVINSDESVGFYSSEKEEGFGGEDIYQVDLLYSENEIHCRHAVLFEDGSEKTKTVRGKVTVTDNITRQTTGIYFSNRNNGKLVINVTPYHAYNVSVEAEGYEDYSFFLDQLNPENENREITIELKRK